MPFVDMLTYFNLNTTAPKLFDSRSVDDPFDLADLKATPGKKRPQSPEDKPSLPKAPKTMLVKMPRQSDRQMSGKEQVALYCGVFVGVLFSSAVLPTNTGNGWRLFAARDLLLASVIALMIIPAAYSKLKINAAAPFIVRFGFFVQTGVFWHEVVRVIGKAFV